MRPLDPLLLGAYEAQAAATQAWLDRLTDDDLALPTRLPGWRVAELAGHVARSGEPYAVAEPAPRGSSAMSVSAYLDGCAAAAPQIAEREAAAAQGISLDRVRSLMRETSDAVSAAAVDDEVVVGPRGPIRRNDLLRTRVLELVVHALDVEDGPAHDRQAVRVCVRLLAAVLAERHPGKAVEVRVPPYAAVQIGEGVTHTRGTPPNVVETSPAVFVAVASGRRPWADAVEAGEVRASGLRADLSPYLPLL